MDNKFGGSWTKEKLTHLKKYLAAYTIIFHKNLKARNLKTTYVDAFAGTGTISSAADDIESELIKDAEARSFIKGSVSVALETTPAFDHYLFIEKDSTKAAELEKVKEKYPDAGIQIIAGEANTFLTDWCRNTDWTRNRAVVFLDPYGMQVGWPLIQSIADTQAIDLWILFPIGAINRLLIRNKQLPKEWEAALTRIFGSDDWKMAFYQTKTEDTLFGEEEVTFKSANFEKIGQYFVRKLKSIFPGVADDPLVLKNSRNVPLFLLCFAASNRKGAPIAVKIAKGILKK